MSKQSHKFSLEVLDSRPGGGGGCFPVKHHSDTRGVAFAALIHAQLSFAFVSFDDFQKAKRSMENGSS